MLVAPSMTWLLVITRPEADRTIPVPLADSLSYRSVEVMSTRPGSTFFLTAAWLSGADDPLPDALLCGPGISPAETVGDDGLLWLSTATVPPAPMLAAAPAPARVTRK